MSAEQDDGSQREISRLLSHVLDLFATLQQHYREHDRLEEVVEAGDREQESRETMASRRARARQALAESQAKIDQIKAEVECSIKKLRKYLHL
jgi:hypothetical protein